MNDSRHNEKKRFRGSSMHRIKSNPHFILSQTVAWKFMIKINYA